MTKKQSLYAFIYLYIAIFILIAGRVAVDVWTAIGAILGIVFLIKYPKVIYQELKNNKFLIVFLACFIPVMISFIDTLNVSRTLSVIGRLIRYFFISVLVILMVEDDANDDKLLKYTFYALLFICIDAMAHWVFQFNVYGSNPIPGGGRVRGIFGKAHHLSYYLGTLAPVIFLFLFKKWEKQKSLLTGVMIGAILCSLICAVIIGGARAGIVSLLVSVFLFVIYLFAQGRIQHKLRFITVMLGVIAISVGIASQSEAVQKRFKLTTTVAQDSSFMHRFTTSRTHLWDATLKVIPQHLVNGTGARAFDAAYQKLPNDYKESTYVYHSHMHGLEVLVETGIIGFIPYLLVCLYLFIRIFTARSGNVWLMVALVAMMPINTHLGLFEVYWMPMIWLPLMIGLAQAYKADKVLKGKPSLLY